MTQVVLPMVYEAARPGRKVKTYEEEVVFDLPDADGDPVILRRTGAMPLRYLVHNGQAYCPLRGPSAPDTRAEQAAEILHQDFESAGRRPSLWSGRTPQSILHVGQRADGTYYPNAAPPRTLKKRPPDSADRARRILELASQVRRIFLVLRGSVWRRCGPPMYVMDAPMPHPGTNALLGLQYGASEEGIPGFGAACVWPGSAGRSFNAFRSTAGVLSLQRPVDHGAIMPDAPDEIPEVFGFDVARANVDAIAALIRLRIADFLPNMSVEAAVSWIACREAEETFRTTGAPGDAAEYFVRLGRLAAVPNVGDDASSQAGRMRWETVKLAIRAAVLRHLAQDLAMSDSDARGALDDMCRLR